MQKKIKNCLVNIGTGYGTNIRLLHAMVKEKSDCSLLFFNIAKEADSVGDDLRLHYSIEYSDFRNTFYVFEKWLIECQFELIGISLMSHHWDIYVEMSKIIRRVLPNCKIITGGVHAWHINSLETLNYCDYVCAAEGEELYSQLVDSLATASTATPFRIPGLIEKYNGEIIRTPVRSYMPIDDLPFPTIGAEETFTLEAINKDRPVFLKKDPLIEDTIGFIHVGRGCMFKCTFCINSVIDDPNTRIRSADKVIAEIRAMLSVCKSVKSIYFMDEIFPVRQTWLPEFCRKYGDQIGLPFHITLYPNMLNEKKVKILKSAGLVEISMGLQSGSERIRRDIYHRKDKNHRLIGENTILAQNNIMTYYDLIIRNPYENETDLSITLDLVHQFSRPYFLKFYTLAFYPNHPLTIRALSEKMINPNEVDATIGYLSVATPHKVVIADHFMRENVLLIWHQRLRKRMLNGMKDDAYYLLICYHGFWFIPKFVLNVIYSEFKNERLWSLYGFSCLLESILVCRQYILFKHLRVFIRKGLIYSIKKLFEKSNRIFKNMRLIPQ